MDAIQGAFSLTTKDLFDPLYCPNGELAKSRRGRASLSNLVVKLIDPIIE